MAKLENKSNIQQTEQSEKNNSKLYLGIGGGILELGLMGIMVYLVKDKEK